MNRIILPTIFTLGLLISCDKKDPIIPNEEEVITTLVYTLTSTSNGEMTIMKFRDLDGDGGNDPVITVESLKANTKYNGKLQLLNEQLSQIVDISEEINKESEDHQFFFQSTIGDVIIDYADADTNGLPLGLASTLQTGEIKSGKLTITLRHQPDKNAQNVSIGDITNAGGETDIQVTFDINVQ